MMILEQFISSFTEKAREVQINHLEFYIKECQEQTVQVYKQEVERISLSDETLVFIEGEFQGYKGSTFVENIATARIDEHLEIIRQIALYNKEPFAPRTLEGKNDLATAGSEPMPRVDEVTKWLKNAEQRVYDYDEKIDNVGATSHSTRQEKIILLNNHGEQCQDFVQSSQFRVSVVAKDDGAVQSSYDSKLSKSITQKDIFTLTDQVAEKVVSQLAATPVKTGRYQVILGNKLVCDLVLAFLPGLYADRVQRKMSVLATKLGEKITSPLFSLIENPKLEQGIITRKFDDEGTPTQEKAIIDQGRLTTFLHNLETARAFEVEATGNGFKNLYNEPPAISVTNLQIPTGTHTLTEMILEMKDGLLITDCDGIFAGANPVSGDFSLIAKGYLVENGAILRAVNQITIGGNYYEMLNEIGIIGSEYNTAGSLSGFIQAPALLITELFVSGT